MAGTEIELELGAAAQPGEYVVRVVRAVGGGEPESRLHLDVDDLVEGRRRLEETVLLSAVRPRGGIVPEIEQPLRQAGQQLFEALFSGPVAEVYRASLAVARERGRRLRVVLRLTAPELSALPWEALFDPEIEAYLCRKEPLVRHVPAPFSPEPLPVHPPLRILGLIASPRGLPTLDVDTEQQHLQDALARPAAAEQVELEWLAQASWDSVHERLLTGQWHVLHFIGHGDYDPATDEGRVALVGANGRAHWVEASRLADLLGAADPTPRLVVLNSCSSGQGSARDLFSGTAATLARSGISAVAAMQFSVSDTAAIAFARGFYGALARGHAVDQAARNGRISILGIQGTLEWVTPVLYLRGKATQLVTLTAPASHVGTNIRDSFEQQGGKDKRAQPSPAAARRRAELRALYVEARAELRLEHHQTALGLLDDLLTLDPNHPGAADLRETAQRGKRLADAYRRAREAEEAGDWVAAGKAYEDILQIEPGYRDAAARQSTCQSRHRSKAERRLERWSRRAAEAGNAFGMASLADLLKKRGDVAEAEHAVSLLVGALVQGLVLGLRGVTSQAVIEGYIALRDAIVREYGQRVEASLKQLEQQPESSERQAALANDLRAGGGDIDPGLTRLADDLKSLIESLTPDQAPDPLERVQRKAGVRAVDQLLDRHIATLMRARSEYMVEDVDLLTTNLVNSTGLPRALRDELSGLHQTVRQVIEEIAVRIEDAKYKDAEQAIAGLQISYNERQRATSLVRADKQLHVSYQTLKVTVEFLSELNQNALMRLERETSPERQSTMMLGNAITIYELTDFVIRYIEGFGVKGADEIDNFYMETKTRIDDVRRRQHDLAERANGPDVEPAVRRQTLNDVRMREAAIDELAREWDNYVSKVKALDSTIDEVRAKTAPLTLIREIAQVQVAMVQETALLGLLKQNTDTIRGTIDALQGFSLPRLSSARVRRLLGIV